MGSMSGALGSLQREVPLFLPDVCVNHLEELDQVHLERWGGKLEHTGGKGDGSLKSWPRNKWSIHGDLMVSWWWSDGQFKVEGHWQVKDPWSSSFTIASPWELPIPPPLEEVGGLWQGIARREFVSKSSRPAVFSSSSFLAATSSNWDGIQFISGCDRRTLRKPDVFHGESAKPLAPPAYLDAPQALVTLTLNLPFHKPLVF